MTLEEAKKKIKAQAEAEWEEFKKTGSMLCQGFALGADDALETLDKVEPAGNPDKLTLKELAHEMRKIFRFKYLVACKHGTEIFVTMYLSKPEFVPIFKGWDRGRPAAPCPIAVSEDLRIDLDLSEYKDENHNIDYSKCIVEVSDDIG